ncbi:hypothetical protein SCP_1502590 [Sparassis crispa]|uniref:SET domain-containing protein n=1 Tax=Sparassis crispa TaxID=139825 RepID=A0A401H4C6_9APHY|nr:hypothetical protein SCP_1502590 [Sparassis crispa]GBE89251.1 hypothetical protein SCP_1502590 [Sparassis crispa]
MINLRSLPQMNHALTRDHAMHNVLAHETKRTVHGNAVVAETVQDDGVDAAVHAASICELERVTLIAVHVAAPTTSMSITAEILKFRRADKRFGVKHSDFGLGVFLMQSAKEGDLIAEYIGELIYEATFDSRGQLSNHRGRSYVFGIDPSLSNDSTYAGNTTRFINHAPEKKANCIVGIRIVHGDHRIGIYAKKSLAKGAELFLDYGPEFYF